MDAAAVIELHKVDEIENLPEGERAELIDGKMYMMAAPSRTHQRLLFELAKKADEYIKKCSKDCEIYLAPFAVYLDDDEYTYVEPDLLVVCDKEKLDEKGCHGAPDFVVEIVSPTSRTKDYLIKLGKYAASGVKEYWIVDPETEKTHVYNISIEDNSFTMTEYDFGEAVKGNLCPELSVVMAELL